MGLFSGSFYSNALRFTTEVHVIFPEPSNDVTPVLSGVPQVLYLLHGLAGSSGEWTRFSKIEYYAKKYNLIVIMPEVQRSFYCDSKAGPRYLTYVADELPELCAAWFNLPNDREHTFIAGESMGGYGAFKAAFTRPERYAAAASLSGVLDYPALVREVMLGRWPDMSPEELYALHGPTGVPGNDDDLIELMCRAAPSPDRPRLYQCCGTEDFLYQNNQTFRRAAAHSGYEIVYQEGPGDHEWPYWDKAVQRAIQFFCGLDIETTTLY